MDVRYTIGQREYSEMNTQSLRDTFLLESLFKPGQIELTYTEIERSIIGSVVPQESALSLSSAKELASDYFCQRRELGILNIGGRGQVSTDGQAHTMEYLDCLYVGRGTKSISFESLDKENLANFYLVSYPAHKEYPTTLVSKQQANPIHLGDLKDSNKRTIYQYIHQNGVQSCQLVMGVTCLEEGSVWNTMPPHTHERRTEVYMYFDFPEDAAVFHFMGSKEETRHIAVAEGEAVVSPMWSIHSGCGTQAYSFCWAMGGENQEFDDMDGIKISELR